MDSFLTAIGFALLPALANFCGGLLVEAMPLSDRALSAALHLAAGVIFAVVGLELMATALQTPHAWAIGLAFICGGAIAVGLDKLIAYASCRIGADAGRAAPWMIYTAVCVDLFSDGIMIGTGSTIATGLALLLALGQVAADVPEGFATMATLRKHGVSRARRLWIGTSFMIPILAGTTLGYWAVRDQAEILKLVLLAITAGLLTTVAVEEMVGQAHAARTDAEEESGWQTIALVSGFALFAMLSVYIDQARGA